MKQKPSVGRIVHIIPPGKQDIHAAIITKVWSGECVNVVYFDCQDMQSSKALTSCTLKEQLEPGNYWAWPARD